MSGFWEYWAIFAVANLIFGMFVLILFFFGEKILERRINVKLSDEYDNAFFGGMFLAMFFIPQFLSIISLSYILDYNPVVPHKIALFEESVDDDIASLNQSATKLRESIGKPKELTLVQIEELINETLNFTDELGVIAEEQNKEIEILREEVELEKEKADESKKIAREIQSLTKTQLEAVKLLITEDARDQANRSFFYGILVSLPVGILASIVGSFFLRRFTGMHGQD